MTGIFCIQITGGALNSELRAALYDGAEAILKRKGKASAKVKGDGFEGRIHTDWKVGRISAVFGTIFKMEIDTEFGELSGSYIALTPHDTALGKPPARPVSLN